MIRFLLPLASILALGCTQSAVQQSAAVPQATPVVMVYDGQGDPYSDGSPFASGLKRDYRRRDVGDFVVYRFTGSSQKAPVTLTKRILARSGDTLEVDVILEQGKKKEKFRVKLSDAPASRDEILAAARIEPSRLVLISVDKFKDLMAKTFVIADENESLVHSEQVTATIGHDPVPARRNTYRVRLGKKHALLRSTSSPDFSWGDIEGEIVTEKGKVLYKAEIIHIGRATVVDKTPQVAASSYDEFE
jgi:hypothetical protein